MTPNASINVSVSSHYREDTYASEIVTQGILGERVELLEHRPLFSRIRQLDGYESWISSDQLAHGDVPAGDPLLVRSHYIRVRTEPRPGSEVIRDGVIGARLNADGRREDWTRVILPDGQTGWVETACFGRLGSATAERLIELAGEFLGCQYLWGGRSPKGFDCSGFVQTVFGLHGVVLPRDAWQQQKHHLVSHDFADARPGDLLFFARTPGKITHVAISTGNLRFVHASGWVRYGSFNESDPDFSREQVDTFVSVNRYPLEPSSS